MENIRVLTLYQPYATLLAHGIKTIETRPGKTSHQGLYLIHAAHKKDKNYARLCHIHPAFNDALTDIGIERFSDLPFGKIIGSFNVLECCEILDFDEKPGVVFENGHESYIEKSQIPFGDYTTGRCAWFCENIKLLKEPFEYKGNQGYYTKFRGDESKIVY